MVNLARARQPSHPAAAFDSNYWVCYIFHTMQMHTFIFESNTSSFASCHGAPFAGLPHETMLDSQMSEANYGAILLYTFILTKDNWGRGSGKSSGGRATESPRRSILQ